MIIYKIKGSSIPDGFTAQMRDMMKKIIAVIFIFGVLGLGNVEAAEFTLTSKYVDGQLSIDQVYSEFGCTGKNISPALKWSNAPIHTRGFAVTVYDPDAPTGRGWWHWVIFNIPSNVTGLKAGAGNVDKDLAPEGSIQSLTDFGKQGYGGACPPKGDKPHRYIFTVYALDTPRLNADKNTHPAGVGFLLYQHTIAKATLTAYYGR